VTLLGRLRKFHQTSRTRSVDWPIRITKSLRVVVWALHGGLHGLTGVGLFASLAQLLQLDDWIEELEALCAGCGRRESGTTAESVARDRRWAELRGVVSSQIDTLSGKYLEDADARPGAQEASLAALEVRQERLDITAALHLSNAKSGR
jgi:hypothetical protein